MRYFYVIFGILLFLATLEFALKNPEPVTLHYFLGLAWSAPLILVLLLTLAIGALGGIFASLSFVVRERRKNIKLQRELQQLQMTPMTKNDRY